MASRSRRARVLRRGERTQYPIYDTPEAFDTKMPPTYLQGVPKPIRADLRNAQPYNPRFELLGPLLRLNDREKHRSLGTIVTSAVNAEVRFSPAHVVSDVRVPSEKVYLDDDAILGWFRSDREVGMNLKLGYAVRFGYRDGPSIEAAAIPDLILSVADILAHFRAAFD